MTVLSLGLVRGVVAQIVGTLLGVALVAAIRLLMGSDPLAPEPMVVVGGMVGILTFLIGVGGITAGGLDGVVHTRAR